MFFYKSSARALLNPETDVISSKTMTLPSLLIFYVKRNFSHVRSIYYDYVNDAAILD